MFVPVFFFSAGLLKLNFNDILVSSTHTLPVNIFNLEGETMLARDKGNFHAPSKNRTRDPPVQWLERPINAPINVNPVGEECGQGVGI